MHECALKWAGIIFQKAGNNLVDMFTSGRFGIFPILRT